MRVAGVQVFSLYFLIALPFVAKSNVSKRSPLEIGLVTFPNPVVPKILRRNILPEKADHHHLHVWVPGQVRRHAFIPPHTIDVFVPVVVAKPVLIKKKVHVFGKLESDPLVGGYGVGSYIGGQGTGHGFQIVFNGD